MSIIPVCVENVKADEFAWNKRVRPLRSFNDGIVDRIAVMLRKENTHYVPCFDYLSINKTSQASNEFVNEGWRRKVCEWSFEVVDHYGFDREVASIAVNYLDRMIAHTTKTTKKSMPKREFQLVAVASLYLAIKLHGESNVEGGPWYLRIDAWVEIGRGMFTVEDIERNGARDSLQPRMASESAYDCLLRCLPTSTSSGILERPASPFQRGHLNLGNGPIPYGACRLCLLLLLPIQVLRDFLCCHSLCY
jgi:hypothetical protein